MKNMGSGVVATGCCACFGVDPRRDNGPLNRFTRNNRTDVATKPRKSKRCVGDRQFESDARDCSDVTDLPAAFGVERRVIEKHLDRIFVSVDDGKNRCFCSVVHITNKFGGAMGFHDLAICLDTVTIGATRLTGALCSCALLVHLSFETRDINFHATFTGDFLSEFQWKAVCVVQKKGRRT